eukprot:496750-Prymnesium_polylepis.1
MVAWPVGWYSRRSLPRASHMTVFFAASGSATTLLLPTLHLTPNPCRYMPQRGAWIWIVDAVRRFVLSPSVCVKACCVQHPNIRLHRDQRSPWPCKAGHASPAGSIFQQYTTLGAKRRAEHAEQYTKYGGAGKH